MKNKKTYFKNAVLASLAAYTIAMLLNSGIYSEVIRTAVMPLIFVLYYWCSPKRCIFLTIFLLAFSFAELTYFVESYNRDVAYYMSCISRVIAYMALFVYIIRTLNFKKLFKGFVFHLIVLTALGTYLFYALDKMLNYHDYVIPIYDYILESAYNLFVILVLVFSFLQYVFHMTKKSLLLFLASLFLCFSELTQVAYYFVKAGRVVSIIYSTFLIFGFYFTYNYISDEEECVN